VLQHVAVCCSVRQCVTVCCSVLQCVAVCCSVLVCDMQDSQYDSFGSAVSVLQCVAVCCSVVQFVAVQCSTIRLDHICVFVWERGGHIFTYVYIDMCTYTIYMCTYICICAPT